MSLGRGFTVTLRFKKPKLNLKLRFKLKPSLTPIRMPVPMPRLGPRARLRLGARLGLGATRKLKPAQIGGNVNFEWWGCDIETAFCACLSVLRAQCEWNVRVAWACGALRVGFGVWVGCALSFVFPRSLKALRPPTQ